MSTLVTITRKTEAIQAFQLQSQTDMIAALDYIYAGGYTGSIQLQNVSGVKTYQMLVNNAVTNTSAFAFINDYIIIENNSVVSVCPAAQFANLYATS